jgi:glycosyltransferase involved in cell wall biosynthesis
MKVSVIIPNYNHAEYLEQRIQSVLNQTYRDFEVIILDDFSTDNSKEVIERFRGHVKIREIVYNKFNSGSTFKQWQKGIELAQGEWIWIAESDDWAELTFLEELLSNEISLNTKILFCHSVVVVNNEIRYLTHGKYLIQKHEGINFIRKRMLMGNGLYNASMVLFKKEAIEYNVFKKIETFKFSGDWFFWVYLIKGGEVLEIGKPLNFFRKHMNDLSGKSYNSGLAHLEDLKVYLLFKEVRLISEFEFKKLIYLKFLTISQVVSNKNLRKVVKNSYLNHISNWYILKKKIRDCLKWIRQSLKK